MVAPTAPTRHRPCSLLPRQRNRWRLFYFGGIFISVIGFVSVIIGSLFEIDSSSLQQQSSSYGSRGFEEQQRPRFLPSLLSKDQSPVILMGNESSIFQSFWNRMSLGVGDDSTRMSPQRFDIVFAPTPEELSHSSNSHAALEPFDVSVNHLRRIELAAAVLPKQVNSAEDYLPVVLNADIQFRFRVRAVTGAIRSAMQDISAYQVVARCAYSKSVLWDSKKVKVKTMPSSIPWGGETLPVGTIVKWRVEVWDYDGIGPSKSEWSKFAVGPSHEEWEAKWIIHPSDANKFHVRESILYWYRASSIVCDGWTKRRPLPLARAKVVLTEEKAKSISSALLVVSGLGSFTASIDGKTLSSSSPLDPPLTDFSQRVYYRGFDVTSFFAGTENEGEHVIGVTLGSGWWDPRPLQGGIVKHWLNPRGALTTVAELHVTYKDGSRSVMIPSGSEGGDWQIAKGYIVDSDLFTGDVMDLGRLEELDGWDSPSGWSDSVRLVDNATRTVDWVEPQIYESTMRAERVYVASG